MIKCLRLHLEQRCRERGYAFDEVRPCIVSEEGDKLIVDETHPSYPHPRKKLGLGDMVASGLASIGITKERVQDIASKVGIKDCGCAKRQKTLNELGTKLGLPSGSNE